MTPFTIRKLLVETLPVPAIDPFVIASGEARAARSILVTINSIGLGAGACLPPVTREE